MSLLLIVVILVSFANLWFYLTIGFEYIYGLDALATAVAMLPAQAAGIGGAALARVLLRRLGITTTGLIMLLALGVCLVIFYFSRRQETRAGRRPDSHPVAAGE